MAEPNAMTACPCPGPHYPLVAMMRGLDVRLTRGEQYVEVLEDAGWRRFEPSPPVMYALALAYNRRHRFDWYHTAPDGGAES